MSTRFAALTVGLALQLGCQPAVTTDNVDELGAERVCKKHRQCRTDEWEDQWGRDMDACRDAYQEALERGVALTVLLGIELDLDAAEVCLRDIRRASCPEFEAGDWGFACDNVLF